MRASFVLAAAFAIFIMAACARGERKAPHERAPTAPTPSASAPLPSPARHGIPRPTDAIAELGVLTDRPKEQLAKLVAPAGLSTLVEARHCGPASACDAVRALIADREHVEVTIASTDDWGLPAPDTLDTIARGLTPSERALVHKRPTVVVVRANGRATPEHVVARAGFALAAAIAERLKGFVYDETLRRIESHDAFAAHAITAALGEPAFREDRIVLQLYEQEDGTARLISLGMRRFGAPDLEVRGARLGAGRALGTVMNAVALRLTRGTTDAPLLLPAKSPGIDVPLDFVLAAHVEGDPDNVVVRLVPPGGATALGYDDLAVAIVGAAERIVDQPSDTELVARAANSFPSAVARWKKMGSLRTTLLVKLPFAIPGDGGVEWMWVDVRSAQDRTMSGVLANSPAFVTDLKNGSPVKGNTKDVADWMLRLPDGGTEGTIPSP